MFIYTLSDIIGVVMLGILVLIVLGVLVDHQVQKVKSWWRRRK